MSVHTLWEKVFMTKAQEHFCIQLCCGHRSRTEWTLTGSGMCWNTMVWVRYFYWKTYLEAQTGEFLHQKWTFHNHWTHCDKALYVNHYRKSLTESQSPLNDRIKYHLSKIFRIQYEAKYLAVLMTVSTEIYFCWLKFC